MKKQITWEDIFVSPDESELVETSKLSASEVESVCEPLSPYLIAVDSDHTAFAPISPVLKWAGGKTQLLTQMENYFPSSFENYHEPFLGGAAVFFHLALKRGKPSWLCDINAELINFYRVVRDQVSDFIAIICTFDKKYRSASSHEQKSIFYQIRGLDRTPDFCSLPPLQRAVRFYALNKTAYNGLYRTNRKGQFNVPWGGYEKPSLCTKMPLLSASEALQCFSVWLEKTSFEAVLDNAKTTDFVYFDPPYVPLSITASFTAYTPEGFDSKSQEKLADVCCELDRHNIQFMLSNSDTDSVHRLYSKFNIVKLQARRRINCNGSGRGPISEVLVTNY